MSDIEGIKEQVLVAHGHLSSGDTVLAALELRRQAVLDVAQRLGMVIQEARDLLQGDYEASVEGLVDLATQASGEYDAAVKTIIPVCRGSSNPAIDNARTKAAEARDKMSHGDGYPPGCHAKQAAFALGVAGMEVYDGVHIAEQAITKLVEAAHSIGEATTAAGTDSLESALSLEGYVNQIAGETL
jgi:hypothetical protein